MRTSNKILLAGFIVTVLIITGVYVTLYAKIKAGDLVVLRQAGPPKDKHMIGAIKHVMVTGMEECHVMYSDSARLELPNDWREHLKWRVNGDSLIVEASGNKDYAQGARVYLPVDLYLPEDVTVNARYSTLYVGGADDSTKAISRVVSTENSVVSISPNLRAGWPVYWKKLQVTSLNGGISVAQDIEIAEMVVTLNNCAFTDEGAKFGNLSVNLDSTSTTILRRHSLEKLKIIKP